MMNHRPSKLSRLLDHMRGLVSLESSLTVNRRDLASASQSEVQLELDFGRRGPSPAWIHGYPATDFRRHSEEI